MGLISGRPRLGKAAQEASKDVTAKKSLQLRTLHIKAAQSNPDEEIDDGFSKAVADHRAALRGFDTTARAEAQRNESAHASTGPQKKEPANVKAKANDIPMPDISSCSSRGPRQKRVADRIQRPRTVSYEQKPDVETMTSWLTELANAVEDDRGKDVLQHACTDQATLLGHFSNKLQIFAYALPPHDALRAATLIAKGALLLESYGQTAAKERFNAERQRVCMALEHGVTSLRSDIVAILASVVMRITTTDSSYLADALLAMAESRAGQQEFLYAMLAHMMWLLAANPRSFRPSIVSKIFLALGRMKTDGGGDGEVLSAISSEANKRALAALQAKLVEILDDFLEEDIGMLAMDPTGCAYLGDAELRRVLHRAGRLQMGLQPESARFLSAMQRLEASARSRLWEPYQAEIMPFMRDYCERISASKLEAEPLPTLTDAKHRAGLRLPEALQ